MFIFSGSVIDILKKGVDRKRTAKASKNTPFKRSSAKDSSSQGNGSARKSESNAHDPEPMVNMETLFDEGLEYENSELMDNIDAELVSLSDLYSLTNNSFSDLGSLDESSDERKSKKRKPNKKQQQQQQRQPASEVTEKITTLKPVVCLNDIYANKKSTSKEAIKCGSYVVVKLASKKTVKHYCAVVRNKTKSGEYEVQYLERKNKHDFIFPEKEIMYKIDNRDVVTVLQEPTVNVKGLRLYYSFPNNNLEQVSSSA